MAIGNNTPPKVVKLIKWKSLSGSKQKWIFLSIGQLLGIMGMISLTLLYSNCGEMKNLKQSLTNLSSEEEAELFGYSDTGISNSKEYLAGQIGFNRSVISEGKDVELSWAFKWGVFNRKGHYFVSFNCTPGLLDSPVSRDGQDFLGVTNTCGPKDSDINKSCTGQAVGKITITPKASRKIYSCQITFKNISLNKDVRFSTSLKVNPIIDAPKPSDSICDRDEAIQGNFDGCNESACLGWGFQYGQISAPIALRVTQTGAKFRVATLKTTTLLKRSDVNALLYAQGCLKSKDLLTGFTFSKREIDNALRATIAKDGSGSTSSFTAEVFTVGDRLLGKQPYQPLSDIDLPRQ